MQPPILKRLLVEDYLGAPPWFGRLLQILNQFMEQTARVLNKNVSFGDNIQARTFSTSFQTPTGYATGSFDTLTFSWSGTALPVACLITNITHQDGTPFLTSVGTPQWRYGEGAVRVEYVAGLVAGAKYNISLLAF